MQLSIALLPLALAVVSAQDYGGGAAAVSSSSSASSTSSAAASSFTSTTGKVVHTVTVGKTGLTFDPDNLTAKVGEQVEFLFYPPTHSVAQASFAKPCAPLNDTSFFSGAMDTSSGVNAKTFTITINDTNPIWIYCGFPTHCQTGMVGVINAPSDNTKTLALFQKAAAAVSGTTTPANAQGGIVGAAAKPASSSGSSSSSSSSTASAASPSKTNASSTLSAVAGVLAGVMSLAFAALIL